MHAIPHAIKPFSHIALGVTGAIDCLSTPILVVALRRISEQVSVIMTRTAAELMSPQSIRMIGDTVVLTDNHIDGWHNHTALASIVDLFLIAPASANTLAKLAHGLADNLLTTFALSVSAPIVLAPSMASGMWTNPLVQRNCSALADLHFTVIPPTLGVEVATLTEQFGAMPKSDGIIEFLLEFKRKRNTNEYSSYASTM